MRPLGVCACQRRCCDRIGRVGLFSQAHTLSVFSRRCRRGRFLSRSWATTLLAIGEVLHSGLATVREFPKELGGFLAKFSLQRIHDPSLPRQLMVMPTYLIRWGIVRRLSSSVSLRPSVQVHENVL